MKIYYASMVGWFVCFAFGANCGAEAAQVTYAFASTVNSISPTATGFPASLAGVNVGAPISGTISYDAATPASVNPLGGVYGAATYYALNSPTFSFDIGGVPFNAWDPTLSAFVWNDYPTTGSSNNDGLIYDNFTNVGHPQFVLGELLLSTSTFSNTALPGGDLPGLYLLELRQAGASDIWVQSGAFGLTQVPEPTTLVLAVLGLAAALVMRWIGTRSRKWLGFRLASETVKGSVYGSVTQT